MKLLELSKLNHISNILWCIHHKSLLRLYFFTISARFEKFIETNKPKKNTQKKQNILL